MKSQFVPKCLVAPAQKGELCLAPGKPIQTNPATQSLKTPGLRQTLPCRLIATGFDTQIISSGLENQKSPPDLSRFGDYGRILKAQPHTYLAKNLAPPGSV